MVAMSMKKNGLIHICLDTKHLNTAILREHYPLPTIEGIVTRLSGAQIVDVEQGSVFTNNLELVYTRVSAKVSNSERDSLRVETANDLTIQALHCTIISSWPTDNTWMPLEFRTF